MHGVYRSGPPRQLGAVVEVRERVLWKCVRVQHEAKSERVHEMGQHSTQHPPGVGEGVKLSTRQSFSGWLNAEALMNIPPIFVTLSTRQSFSGWLNAEAPLETLWPRLTSEPLVLG